MAMSAWITAARLGIAGCDPETGHSFSLPTAADSPRSQSILIGSASLLLALRRHCTRCPSGRSCRSSLFGLPREIGLSSLLASGDLTDAKRQQRSLLELGNVPVWSSGDMVLCEFPWRSRFAASPMRCSPADPAVMADPIEQP